MYFILFKHFGVSSCSMPLFIPIFIFNVLRESSIPNEHSVEKLVDLEPNTSPPKVSLYKPTILTELQR